MNDVLRVIKSRRSVRSYTEEQIRQENLDAILEAGMYAPTAHNEQPWHFTIIQNQEMLNFMNDKTKEGMSASDVEWIKKMGSKPEFHVSYHAPTLIVVSVKENHLTWGSADCAAAVQNMMLAAKSLEIGSVWIGFYRFFFEQSQAVAKLNLPEGYVPLYAVAFGHSRTEFAAPKRNANVVNYIR